MSREVLVLQVLGHSAGGIARHVAHITEALRVREHLRIEIAAPPELPIAMPEPVHDLSIPDGPVIGHRPAIARLRELIQDLQPTLVHAHGLRAGIDCGLAAKGSDVRSLLTVHNLVRGEIAGPLKSPLYRWAETLAVRLSDRVLCVSQEITEHLRARPGVDADKVETLYLGVAEPPKTTRSTSEIRASLGMASDGPLIVTASRLAPQKRLQVMLQAVKKLPTATLCVLGEGLEEASLRADVERLGLADRVHLLGFHPAVHEYIAAADVFCLSSIWEGIPLAAQEALTLGTPVVATAVGGMRELIEDGVSGRLVPANDPEALALALSQVLEDASLAARFGDAGKRAIEARFSEQAMLESLAAMYAGGPDAS